MLKEILRIIIIGLAFTVEVLLFLLICGIVLMLTCLLLIGFPVFVVLAVIYLWFGGGIDEEIF